MLDLIGIAGFGLLIPALLLMVLARFLNKSSKGQSNLAFLSVLLFGIGAITAGAGFLGSTLCSAQFTSEGYAIYVSPVSGGKHPSTYFNIQTQTGRSPRLDINYVGPYLHNGAKVQAIYLQYDGGVGTVIHLKALDESAAGWMVNAGDGRWNSIFMLFLGVAAIIFAFYARSRNTLASKSNAEPTVTH